MERGDAPPNSWPLQPHILLQANLPRKSRFLSYCGVVRYPPSKERAVPVEPVEGVSYFFLSYFLPKKCARNACERPQPWGGLKSLPSTPIIRPTHVGGSGGPLLFLGGGRVCPSSVPRLCLVPRHEIPTCTSLFMQGVDCSSGLGCGCQGEDRFSGQTDFCPIFCDSCLTCPIFL